MRQIPRPIAAGLCELRIAVASPFVDRRHGTERALAELLLRLADEYQCEVHLYSQSVEDLQVSRAAGSKDKRGGIYWHRVPSLPGPHLLLFLSWFFLNRVCRIWDRIVHGLRFDLVFSPGINCADANVILVHAVFHRLAELQCHAAARGLRGLHQRLYYRFVCALERRIYTDPRVTLAAVSRHTAEQLSRYFGRNDAAVIPNGVDSRYFSPAELLPLREAVRQLWGFHHGDKVLLLMGNDWNTKGLPALLEAASLCSDLSLRLLIVGQESPDPFAAKAEKLGLRGRVIFVTPDPDVRRFYAAADVLVAPTLEDSFNLPALEAMSCGLPVIVSANAGISEWITNGEDGVILRNAQDGRELAEAIRALVTDPEHLRMLSENAVRAAATLSWDRHAVAVAKLLQFAASHAPSSKNSDAVH